MAGGNKFAYLVGFNYPNDLEFMLKGCWKDVQNMYETLISRCGFDTNNIVIVTDKIDKVATAENIKDRQNPKVTQAVADETRNNPTAESIKNGLKSMADRAEVEDSLFFYFSGQGVKTSNEAGILDWDLQIIPSFEITEIVKFLSEELKVAVTIMSDSSCSEGLLKNFDHGILLSGCRLEESRHEMTDAAGNYYGAFTYAVQKFLEDGPCPRTNEAELLWVNQHPCLHCSPGKDVARCCVLP